MTKTILQTLSDSWGDTTTNYLSPEDFERFVKSLRFVVDYNRLMKTNQDGISRPRGSKNACPNRV